MTNCLYLNNDGSRWRFPGAKVRVFEYGRDLGTRAVDHFEAFGNFAAVAFRVKGKRYTCLARDTVTFSPDADGGKGGRIIAGRQFFSDLEIVDLERSRGYAS